MTFFTAEVDDDAAAAGAEAASGGNGTYPPLSGGKYQVTVLETVKVEPFGGNGGNANKSVVRIKFKIDANSPTGKGRTYYGRIPLFTRFAPNEKNPQGAAARGYWDFWGKAMGVPIDALSQKGAQLPGPDQIGGRPLTITLGAPLAPNEYNPLGYNEIEFYDAAGDVNASPTNAPVVPWLDASGNLVGGAAPAAPGQQAPAANTAPPAWGAPPAPAAPVAQPLQAVAQYQSPAQTAPPAWGQPQQPLASVTPIGGAQPQQAWNPANDVAAAQIQAAANNAQGFGAVG